MIASSERQRGQATIELVAALLTFCATDRLFDAGGAGALAWLALLALCSYGVYWVWTQYRSYT